MSTSNSLYVWMHKDQKWENSNFLKRKTKEKRKKIYCPGAGQHTNKANHPSSRWNISTAFQRCQIVLREMGQRTSSADELLVLCSSLHWTFSWAYANTKRNTPKHQLLSINMIVNLKKQCKFTATCFYHDLTISNFLITHIVMIIPGWGHWLFDRSSSHIM